MLVEFVEQSFDGPEADLLVKFEYIVRLFRDEFLLLDLIAGRYESLIVSLDERFKIE